MGQQSGGNSTLQYDACVAARADANVSDAAPGSAIGAAILGPRQMADMTPAARHRDLLEAGGRRIEFSGSMPNTPVAVST